MRLDISQGLKEFQQISHCNFWISNAYLKFLFLNLKHLNTCNFNLLKEGMFLSFSLHVCTEETICAKPSKETLPYKYNLCKLFLIWKSFQWCQTFLPKIAVYGLHRALSLTVWALQALVKGISITLIQIALSGQSTVADLTTNHLTENDVWILSSKKDAKLQYRAHFRPGISWRPQRPWSAFALVLALVCLQNIPIDILIF